MYSKLTKTILVCLLFCLFACSEREERVTDPDERVPVSFAAGIRTRVMNTNWEYGDGIGISMLKSGSMEIAAATFNRQYQASGQGSLSTFLPQAPVETIYYPLDDSRVDFIAYYPFSKELKSLGNYQVSVADQRNRKWIDLLVARAGNAGKDSPSVKLEFRHQLTSLEFNLKPGDVGRVEDLAGAVLKIKNIPVAGNYDLTTEKIDLVQSGDVAVLMSTDGVKGQAIVLPREAGSEVWFEIMLRNGISYSAYLSAESQWEQATWYTYTITLRKRPVPVDISVSITDWTTGTEQGKLE